ncbi:MAG: hypothetical protein LBQ48_06030 [Oscillospiraceae bacterium]|nr:hypothetical protein [Oscillospiraceae bacterium]
MQLAVDPEQITEPQEADAERPVYIVGEEKSLRKENVKTFRMSDGSHVAGQYVGHFF